MLREWKDIRVNSQDHLERTHGMKVKAGIAVLGKVRRKSDLGHLIGAGGLPGIKKGIRSQDRVEDSNWLLINGSFASGRKYL